MQTTLEVCTGTFAGALAAQRGGAQRVELCSGLAEGGITPSVGLMRAVADMPGLRKHVLIRPRGGDFLYDEDEVQIMLADIAEARRAGMDGVVIGALTPEGDVDLCTMRRLVEAAEGLAVTFHRAFDLCRQPEQALEHIVGLGCRRLLTSGQAATALQGLPLIARLVELADGRISIMPGCGVSALNAAEIISGSGATEIHASSRALLHSQMRYRRDGVGMGKDGADEYARLETSEEAVRAIVGALEKV